MKSPTKPIRPRTRVASLATLGERADAGEAKAIGRLTALAEAQGIDPDDYATWAELEDETRTPTPTFTTAAVSAALSARSPDETGPLHQLAGKSRKAGLSTWEGFWYLLMCIPMGAGYFAKIPAKKALHEAGLAEISSAERFWYVVGCIPLGLFYLCKIPTAKALAELSPYRSERRTALGNGNRGAPTTYPIPASRR